MAKLCHLGQVWDAVAEAAPDAPAVIFGDERISWRDYESRAARIAGALGQAGVAPGSKVAIFGLNSRSWVEAQYAAHKARAMVVNVNYRYRAAELVYLLDNADAEVLFFDTQFGRLVHEVRPKLPKLRLLVEMEDGAGVQTEFADRLEDLASNERLPTQAYCGDDLQLLYTGGTTGMPKGVLYRHEDFIRTMLGTFAARGYTVPATRDQLIATVRQIHAEEAAPIAIPASPIMHFTGNSMGVYRPHCIGGATAILRYDRFDAVALWEWAQRVRATDIAIVGDAFAKPMIAALNRAESEGRPFDLAALKRISSSGAMFSQESKVALLRSLDIAITDAMGASEGVMGGAVVTRATGVTDTANFAMGATTKVFNEAFEEVKPGSDEIGLLATAGMVPVGYYKDEVKSAATFKTIRGVRYSFPGDYAKVAADGSIVLLGRGSGCINTGGEKVFPEEVEEALKQHEKVSDCLVVGLSDERFGQRVVAIVEASDSFDDREALIDFVRARLAGYKAPKAILFSPGVRRLPNGKADYAWARAHAQEHLQAQ